MAVTITEILATGPTALESATVSVDAGGVNTLILRAEDAASGLEVQIQSSTGWVFFGSLSNDSPVKQVSGPGNYRLLRRVGNNAGADKAV